MSWQLSPAMMLFMFLAVIFYYGSQVRGFPEVTDSSQPTTAATVQATAKPSFLQTTNQEPHKTTAARSTSGPVTSQIAATTSDSETSATHTTAQPPTTANSTLATLVTANSTLATLVTANSTLATSPTNHTIITTQATPSSSHTAAPVTEATIGPSAASASLPTTTPPPAHPTGTSPWTVSHTAGKTVPPSNQTTFPSTFSTSSHISTTSQNPSQPTHAPETATTAHNATQTASPATVAPGPTLAPQPSSVKTGIYQVLNGSRLCIKAEMGIELTVQDRESRYFNIDPNATQASGNCGFRNANLLLNFQGGFVNLTFTKDENSYYISEVEAHLTVSNPEKSYHGLKSGVTVFETVIGHSFKCVSEQSVQLSASLQLKTMNVQLQAFDFEDDHFGNVDECSSDYTIVLPVIGAIVLGLCAVGLIVYGIRLRRESSGYQRI
ncbi:lysosome-associated membrane glycoprotein 3 isoform X2 [Phyllostomus hastatus]|uniref:lysosome-associated membrane glycoprotein 3 isoform X2 n=1 Tax=Phyllostomus hastatus TaxID=9423 RepID=UPI001E6856B6|nr:lysosome-associated membrane glycoprotein 3 isoform X2 [Phyllostomus hastatus]